MTNQVLESGNNVRGLRSILLELDEGTANDFVLFFPDDRDLKLDLSTMDLAEFWISHANITGLDVANMEFRLKTKAGNFYYVDIDLQANNWIRHQYRRSEFSTIGSPDWEDINIVEFYFPVIAGAKTGFDDGFETDMGNWVPYVTGTSTVTRSTNRPHTGSYSLYFDANSGVDYCRADNGFPGSAMTSGVVRFHYWVNMDVAANFYNITGQVRKDGEINAIAYVRFMEDVGIQAYDYNGPSWRTIVADGDTAFDVWYFVVVLVDLDITRYDAYVYDASGDLLGSYGSMTAGSDGEISRAALQLSVNPTGDGYIDDVYCGNAFISGQLQIDGFVMRKQEIYAVSENIESQKIWGVRELPLLDKDVIEEPTAQELVNTILHYSQYPTIRVNANSPFISNDLIGKTIDVESKKMKWSLPVTGVSATLDPKNDKMDFTLGRKVPNIQEILEGFGIEQGRITIGGSGIDFGSALEQFDKACFQTCETTCQICGYGAVCESGCQKTGCLTQCEISLCMSNCQTLRDRYENWCSPGTGCQTCVESPAGPIV